MATGNGVAWKHPNIIVYMDIRYMGNIDKEHMKYVLVLTDDLSANCWLMPYANRNTETTTITLVKWMALFEA